MTNEIDFSENIISVEDMTNRVEELRDMINDAFEENEEGHNFTNVEEYRAAIKADASPAHAHKLHLEEEELTMLESALSEMAGYGGNHQWEGTWYPDYLTAESHFETAMDELIDDIGDIPKDLPSYLTVVIDYTALRMDYTSIEIAGHDFLYR